MAPILIMEIPFLFTKQSMPIQIAETVEDPVRELPISIFTVKLPEHWFGKDRTVSMNIPEEQA